MYNDKICCGGGGGGDVITPRFSHIAYNMRTFIYIDLLLTRLFLLPRYLIGIIHHSSDSKLKTKQKELKLVIANPASILNGIASRYCLSLL